MTTNPSASAAEQRIEPTTTTTTTLIHRAERTPGPWWRHAVVYQIYPRSFADANGDGMGDLPGITARLGHLARLGVDALWLSPFYVSPQVDGGYDVADHRDVDPRFGTLADFDALVARAHRLGLKVLVDVVPNHTSSAHPWFAQALADTPGGAARERYWFRDGRGAGGAEPPTDWTSMFGGPAWTRVTEADGSPGQWYLHLFAAEQPDLNWENPEVRAEFEDILRFWADRGVDGFRIDVAHGLVKDPALPDLHGAPTKTAADLDRLVTGAADVGPMWDQEGVHEIYRSWHALFAEGPEPVALCGEAWVEPLERLARYVRGDELSQTFNFTYLVTPAWAPLQRAVIAGSLRAMDAVGAPATWVLSNHDVVRPTSRLGLADPTAWIGGIGPDDPQPDRALGLRRARALALLSLALPGSAYIYQGEELGLPEHTTLAPADRRDPTFVRTGGAVLGRDGCRVPIPWEAQAPAYGFSPTGASWLPQPEDWGPYALDAQRGVGTSTYEMYRVALRVRRDYRLGSGSLAWVEGIPSAADDDLVAFVNRQVLVLANLGTKVLRLPGDLRIVHTSAELPVLEDGSILVPPATTLWSVPTA